MSNEEVAKVISDIVYRPKRGESDPYFAVQLLVEKLCIPTDIESYSQEDVRKNVLWHLDMSDVEY